MSGERSRPNWVAQKKYEALDYWDQEAQARIKEGKYVRAFGNWTMKQLAKAHSESWAGLAFDVASLGSGGLMVKGVQAGARAIKGARVLQSTESLRSVARAAAAIEKTAPKFIKPLTAAGTGIVTPRRVVKAVSLTSRSTRTEPGLGREPQKPTAPPHTTIPVNLLPPAPRIRIDHRPAPAPLMKPRGSLLVQPPEVLAHTVQAGENLTRIAQRYRVPLKDFVDANPELLKRNGTRLRGADYLRIGDRLKLPGSFQARGPAYPMAPDATYSLVDMNRLAGGAGRTLTSDLGAQFRKAIAQNANRPTRPLTAQEGREFDQWARRKLTGR